MPPKRVVITGLGTVNPLGSNAPDFWSALLAGDSGIAPITLFDTEGFPSRIGGEVKNWTGPDPEALAPKEIKRLDRFSQFAVQAGVEAANDSQIDFTTENLDECGVLVGSGIGGLQTLETQHLRMLNKGPTKISPFTVPRLMVNAAPAHLAIRFGLRGVNFGIVTSCASASDAIGQAIRTL